MYMKICNLEVPVSRQGILYGQFAHEDEAGTVGKRKGLIPSTKEKKGVRYPTHPFLVFFH